jgi:hypothetical protein
MINTGGNLSAVQNSFKDSTGKVKKIKCFVKEAFPHFLVTDNHFYIPCYFTKGAVDDFKSKHSGVNITDLKSKVVEIGEWTLEMSSVDSSTVFTSYAGIEVRLVVKNFKLVQGNQKVLLSRYPVNLYRDDEMKTLFQAYHHRTLTGKLPSKDSLPDVTKKGDSVVSFGSGKFTYGFKSGNTATVDLKQIAKNEKGANFLNALKGSSSGPAVVKAVGGAKGKKASKATPAGSKGVKAASKAISKGTKNNKQSVARVGGKVPNVGTPGQSASRVATPNLNKNTMQRMKAYLKNKGKK